MHRTLSALTLAASLAFTAPAFGNVVHVLAFRYKAGVTAAQRADLSRRIVALKVTARRDGRPYIVSIRGGEARSREGFDRGLQQLFVIEFRTTDDRDFFVGPPYRSRMDPAHRLVADVVEPNVERGPDGKVTGLFVFDFDERSPAKRR